MRDLFASIYEVFKSMYGADLGQHLYGWTGTDYTGDSLYVSTGWTVLIITLITTVLFYYIINSPKFSRWYHWLLILVTNATLVSFIAYYMANSDVTNGNVATDIETLISDQNLFYWGVTNGLIASLLFIIYSFLIRWWSTNCSTTPIPQ